MIKNVYLPKISNSLQFGGEILAMLCRDDSIQILLILSQFQRTKNWDKIKSTVKLQDLKLLTLSFGVGRVSLRL